MRAVFRCIALVTFSVSTAAAQEALTYSFDGRAGAGYLSQTTGNDLGTGFEYKGPVLRIEGTGRVEFGVTETLSFGALARVSLELGRGSNYDRLTPVGPIEGGGKEFGGTNLDLAVYASLPGVTLSYGDMETSFDLATREIEQGSSILDGGNAVWMNIGDGAGSGGNRGDLFLGPGEGPDLRTLRADVQLGEVTLSASRSTGTTTFGTEIVVDAAGLIWQHDIDETSFFLGVGYDKGPQDRFRSVSLGVTSHGFNLVLGRIHREPLVVTSGLTAAYDTTFKGASLSYDFGNLTLGVAQSSQDIRPFADAVFEGKAQAVFLSWQARENATVDFEYSQSDYRIGSGDDTRKASLSIALDF